MTRVRAQEIRIAYFKPSSFMGHLSVGDGSARFFSVHQTTVKTEGRQLTCAAANQLIRNVTAAPKSLWLQNLAMLYFSLPEDRFVSQAEAGLPTLFRELQPIRNEIMAKMGALLDEARRLPYVNTHANAVELLLDGIEERISTYNGFDYSKPFPEENVYGFSHLVRCATPAVLLLYHLSNHLGPDLWFRINRHEKPAFFASIYKNIVFPILEFYAKRQLLSVEGVDNFKAKTLAELQELEEFFGDKKEKPSVTVSPPEANTQESGNASNNDGLSGSSTNNLPNMSATIEGLRHWGIPVVDGEDPSVTLRRWMQQKGGK